MLFFIEQRGKEVEVKWAGNGLAELRNNQILWRGYVSILFCSFLTGEQVRMPCELNKVICLTDTPVAGHCVCLLVDGDYNNLRFLLLLLL